MCCFFMSVFGKTVDIPVFCLLLENTWTPSRHSGFCPLFPNWAALGGSRNWEKTQQLIRSDQSNILYHNLSCSATKVQGKGKTRKTSVLVFAFSISCFVCSGSTFQEVGGHLTTHCKSETSSFVLLACTAFASPIKLSLTWSMSALTLFLLFWSYMWCGWSFVC